MRLHLAIAPDSVLYNMQACIVAKWAAGYGRSIAEDFVFVPDLADEDLADSVFYRGWTRDREIEAFSNMLDLPEAAEISFVWTSGGSVPSEGGLCYTNLGYQLDVVGLGEPLTLSGKADLYLEEVNGIWSVGRWVDKRDGSSNRTLGYARVMGKLW